MTVSLRSSPLKEIEFQRQVVQLAHMLGWESIHFRPAMTKGGWRTPGSGTMARGFPDLLLVRERDRRLIFAELKRDGAKLSPEQERVVGVLRRLQGSMWAATNGFPLVQTFVWRPADFDSIQEVLR